MSDRALRTLVEGARDRIVGFCQHLLRTPSFSCQEKLVAELVVAEMRCLGYDQVEIDGAGNVIGLLKGGSGSSTLLHAHMDVVDPGDAARWSHAPFAGDLAEGFLWGRGAADTKGSLAAQVYALGLLRQAGLAPAGDVFVSAVVGEETLGIGTRHLVRTLRPAVAIIGEPSSNTVRRGHRGRFEFIVRIEGRPGHASAPSRAVNPHYSMARFLLALHALPMVRDGTFGGSTVAPTLIYTDQTSSNVIPAELSVHLDWRNVPQEKPDEVLVRLEHLTEETLDFGVRAKMEVRTRVATTYTGYQETVRLAMPAFCTAAEEPRLVRAHALLEEALGHAIPVGVWAFATDGGPLAEAGVTCVGFGPGEESMAHVIDERIAVEQLLEATAGYMALALGMGRGGDTAI